ncbi:hypothetical protein SpCBS45565_g02621 [Spizellomyces sp. 'palustris']|nr:hypothetical protein SpCBS45565_g02621 [Spizellomyces sp. 'palustris']
MGNLLGKDKSKAPKITSKDKAVLDLKIQRDKLRQYQKKIQVILSREVEVAKHHLRSGDQGRALLALKKKKYQEHLLAETDQQLLNLEQLTSQIEFALVEQDVVKGLQQGNEILKQIHQEMSMDAVQKLMDDTADAIAYQAEIDELISGKISPEDEEEIMAQLDALEAEEIAAKLPDVPAAEGEGSETTEPVSANKLPIDLNDLPPVPTKELPSFEEPDEAAEYAKTSKTAKAQDEPKLEEPLMA